MQVYGRTLEVIFEVDSRYAQHPGLILPDSRKLLNFEFSMGDHQWLYLDPYGDEIMLPEMHSRFFGDGGRESIAVCLDTGDLALARFSEETDGLGLALYVETLDHWTNYNSDSGVAYRVPKEYLSLLHNLRTMKRPFAMSVCEQALFQFIDREIGYAQLREFLTITLDLRPKGYLEVWGDNYRWISPWERDRNEGK